MPLNWPSPGMNPRDAVPQYTPAQRSFPQPQPEAPSSTAAQSTSFNRPSVPSTAGGDFGSGGTGGAFLMPSAPTSPFQPGQPMPARTPQAMGAPAMQPSNVQRPTLPAPPVAPQQPDNPAASLPTMLGGLMNNPNFQRALPYIQQLLGARGSGVMARPSWYGPPAVEAPWGDMPGTYNPNDPNADYAAHMGYQGAFRDQGNAAFYGPSYGLPPEGPDYKYPSY